MRLRETIFGLAVAGALAVSAQAETTLTPNEAASWLSNYAKSSDFKQNLETAFKHLSPATMAQCHSPKLADSGKTIFLEPLVLDDHKGLVGGAWEVRLPLSGCGLMTLANFVFLASKQKGITAFPILPGATQADPLLQKDSKLTVFAAAVGHAAGKCTDMEIINTGVGRVSGKKVEYENPNSVLPNQIWSEVWTVRACEKKLAVPIQFVPDSITKPGAKGTSFNVVARDIIELPDSN